MTPQETSDSLDNKPNPPQNSIDHQYHEIQEKIAHAKTEIKMLKDKINELERKVDQILSIHNNNGDVTEN